MEGEGMGEVVPQAFVVTPTSAFGGGALLDNAFGGGDADASPPSPSGICLASDAFGASSAQSFGCENQPVSAASPDGASPPSPNSLYKHKNVRVAKAYVSRRPGEGVNLSAWMVTPVDMSSERERFPEGLRLADVAEHSSKDDCWIIIRNEVYDITKFMQFHPGGQSILLTVAGTDATEAFNNNHTWVNIETMIGKCHIGSLCAKDADDVGHVIGTIGEDEEEEEDDDA
mmetsp:Transcript_32054/g.73506  ORF Transcript_32054/g.73506 Transcript_32054/m.73506 type:complete len:229 (+) Transcript_32054:3-689(+)